MSQYTRPNFSLITSIARTRSIQLPRYPGLPSEARYISYNDIVFRSTLAPGLDLKLPPLHKNDTSYREKQIYVLLRRVASQILPPSFTAAMPTLPSVSFSNSNESEIPPGGGTGPGGIFSGDTGLGANHRAPGATFDVVFDCSGAGFLGSNMWALIASLVASYVGGPGFTWANKRAAILLPEREFNTFDDGPFGAPSQGIAINNTDAAISFNLPQAAGVQWHFIAPWPTATLEDAPILAKAAQKKFKLFRANASGLALNNGGASLLRMSWNQPGTRFGFWFCEMQANAETTMSVSNLQTIYGFLTLFGCDLLAEIPYQQIGAMFPLDTIATTLMGIDHVHYCLFDNPWAERHHIYEHSPGPVGDCYCSFTTFDRCGGQVWQQTRREDESGGPIPDLTNGAVSAGKHHFVDCTFENYGRSASRSTSAHTQYGTRRDYDMLRCTYINDLPGRADSWPPPDPYSHPSTWPATVELRTSDCITMSAQDDTPPFYSYPSINGHHAGALKMRDCNVYDRDPLAAIIRVNQGTNVDIEDCGFFTSAAATEKVALMLAFDTGVPPGNTPPTYSVLSFRMVNCNSADRYSRFLADHPTLADVGDRFALVLRCNPPPDNGVRNQVPATTLGNATESYDIVNVI
jgi:hypothetical protein